MTLKDYHIDLVILWREVEGITYADCIQRLADVTDEPINEDSLALRVLRRKQKLATTDPEKADVITNPGLADETAVLKWLQAMNVLDVQRNLVEGTSRDLRGSMKLLLDVVKTRRRAGVEETEDEAKTVNQLLESFRAKEAQA